MEASCGLAIESYCDGLGSIENGMLYFLIATYPVP